MVNPISGYTRPIAPLPPQPVGCGAPAAKSGDFASLLRRQLEQVSNVQNEADRGVEKVLTGQSDNVTEVLTAARKAEVAFSLLMEVRNKLVDAYTELRQIRV
jgi:flagellar hook-basal body complex protein FliE